MIKVQKVERKYLTSALFSYERTKKHLNNQQYTDYRNVLWCIYQYLMGALWCIYQYLMGALWCIYLYLMSVLWCIYLYLISVL